LTLLELAVGSELKEVCDVGPVACSEPNYARLATQAGGSRKGDFSGSVLKSLLRGEAQHRCVPALFAGGQRARRGGNPPAPAFPGGETGNGER
jgi:hypothetical protein